jgi:DNA polymerase III delta prime subunit
MEHFFKIEKKIEKVEINENDLYINKNIPKKLSDFKIHNNIATKLLNILKDVNILNLFLYGASGSGKYTISRFYIQTYYNDICRLELKNFKNDSKDIGYYRSKYHYEVIFNNYNFNDTSFVCAFMNKIVNKDNYSFTNKKNVILLKNIDLLKPSVFKIIIFYIEKYYLFNIFIIISNNLFERKYMGYFCQIRVPLPNEEEMKMLCKDICKSENIKIKKSEMDEIVKISERNMSKLNDIIEYSYISGKYEKYIDPINDKLKFLYKIMKKKNINSLIIIRELLQELLVENIEPDIILKYLLSKYIKDYNSEKISYQQLTDIIVLLKDCSYKINNGLRPIINFEYCLIEIIDLL